jgi:hypothetical protein
MASIITATTTSGLTQSADNSGVLQLASGVGNLVTVPSSTGTIALTSQLPVAGPAFSAYKTSHQSYSDNTWTKITYDTEEYDTNSNFASSRFTPTVAGYYLFTARNQFIADGTAMAEVNSAFWKNGAIAKTGTYKYQPAALTAQFGSTTSAVIYCNGSTDYVECYVRTDGSTLYVYGAAGAAPYTYFQGTLMRTA